jgi:hypothetical protein
LISDSAGQKSLSRLFSPAQYPTPSTSTSTPPYTLTSHYPLRNFDGQAVSALFGQNTCPFPIFSSLRSRTSDTVSNSPHIFPALPLHFVYMLKAIPSTHAQYPPSGVNIPNPRPILSPPHLRTSNTLFNLFNSFPEWPLPFI